MEELKHVAEEEEVSSIMSPDWYPRCRQAGFACQYLGQYWSHEPESSHNPDRNTPVYLITSNDLPETSCLSSRGVVLDTASEGLEVAGNRKKIKKSTFLIFFDRFLDCDFLHNFARKRKFTPILW